MANKDHDPRRSSVAVGDDDGGKKKGGGFLPLVLGLLALLAIAIVIGFVSCSSGGGDDKKKTATTPATTSTTPSTPSTSTPTTATPADAGTLTAASQSLLGSDATPIKDQVGEDATGSRLKVLSLSKNGFFVGKDESDRQYVEFGGKVGVDEPNSDRPQVGDTVDLNGPVRPAPDDPEATLKLSSADAAFVKEQGAYVNADTVTPNAG
jgi:hypothetical protein